MPLIQFAENGETDESRSGDAMHVSGRKAGEAHGVDPGQEADRLFLLAWAGKLVGVSNFGRRLFSLLN